MDLRSAASNPRIGGLARTFATRRRLRILEALAISGWLVVGLCAGALAAGSGVGVANPAGTPTLGARITND